MTPKVAKDLLGQHASALREEIKKSELLGGTSSDRERMDYVAGAIEQFLTGKAKTLDAAFGVTARRGPPSKPGKHFELTKKIIALDLAAVFENPRRPHRKSWKQIARDIGFVGNATELPKMVTRHRKAAMDWYADQLKDAALLRSRDRRKPPKRGSK